VFDGAPLLRIEGLKIGACHLNGNHRLEKRESVIHIVLATTSIVIAMAMGEIGFVDFNGKCSKTLSRVRARRRRKIPAIVQREMPGVAGPGGGSIEIGLVHSHAEFPPQRSTTMRYILFLGALIVSLELFGASFATAMPASGTIVKANSTNVIQVAGGCGKHYHRDKANQCVPD
jgi:hypothetical protein